MSEEKKDAVETETAPVAGAEAPPAANPPAAVPEAALQPAPVAVATGGKPAEELAKKPPATPSSAMVVEASAARRSAGFSRQAGRAAVVAAAIGLGWMGGWATSLASVPAGSSATMVGSARQWLAATLGATRPEAGEARQLAGDIQGLKAGLDDVRASLERNRADDAERLAQFGERLEAARRADRDSGAQLAGQLQRAEQATTTKLANLAERFDKVERQDRDPTPRLTQIVERLDRMERQLTPAPAASPKLVAAAANEPVQTGAVAEQKPATVENWALRDVYNGVALIEGKNRRLMEIVPGQNLPGVGRVEAIERRGKTWVVVTSRGIITSQAW